MIANPSMLPKSNDFGSDKPCMLLIVSSGLFQLMLAATIQYSKDAAQIRAASLYHHRGLSLLDTANASANCNVFVLRPSLL